MKLSTMKFKFLALALSLTFICPSLQAKNVKSTHKQAKTADLLGKDQKIRTYFSASDDAVIEIPAPTVQRHGIEETFFNGLYVPLTFTRFVHAHGKGIKAKGDTFLLDKGVYLVLFSGTFNVNGDEGEAAFFDITLHLGSSTVFTNSDSHVQNFDSTGISTFFKVIQVNKPTNLKILARNRASFAISTTSSTMRSLTIIKLDS